MSRETKIIALTGKGGVGKTSISAALVKLLVEEFPEKKILISEISAVEVTVMPVSSYALSLDRLIIYKGDTQWLLVSPVNKQDFVKLLKKHNSDIRIKDPVI